MASTSNPGPHVVIIGAGIAGISMAIALKNRLGYSNFTIYEKASEIGGTWRDNTYPGCASDVPGHAYSLSTELNPHWRTYLVSQPEIRAYWEGLFYKYELSERTVFDACVVRAEWDGEGQGYEVTVEKGGERRRVRAEVVVSAIGGLMRPEYPKDLPGLEKFRGEAWHSATWRHDVDLRGKRVGVIGNGCSASQLIPEISADPSVEVIHFCRSPQWFAPRTQYTYPSWVKWAFAHVPLVMRAYRNFLLVQAELSYVVFRRSTFLNNVVIEVVRKVMTDYMRRTAPVECHDKLIPSFPPGCKRVIVDPGYLASLHRPNVCQVWEPLSEITEEGVKSKEGKVWDLDVIVFGTGFSLDPVVEIHGGEGKTMREYFASKGGPSGYLGTCLPGFPNLFTLLGPNVATGHASVVYSEEVQIGYVVRLIKPVIDGAVKSLAVRAEVADRYEAWVQRRMEKSVWVECSSWYRAEGEGEGGKVVANFPGPMVLFWWLARRPRWDEFVVVGGVVPTARRGAGMLLVVVVVACLVWEAVLSS